MRWSQHLDACLGCRGCEPVCPSGVAYGRGLEPARERLFDARGLPPLARAVLAVFRRERLWRPLFTAGAAGFGAGTRPPARGPRTGGFSMAMLAAHRAPGSGSGVSASRRSRRLAELSAPTRPTHRRPLPRLRHGHPLPPRPRRHPPHARGQRLPRGRGRGPGLLRRPARARRRPGGAPRSSRAATSPRSPMPPTSSS